MITNELKFVIPSKSSNESFARVAVASFVAQLDPTLEEINDIKTAVSEAVTNCIVHAYKESVGNIYITVQVIDNLNVKIKVRDNGCGIDNIKQAMQPLFTTGGEERAGLGFAVMESFMDKLSVKSKEGKGTVVIMQKKLSIRLS